MARFLQQPNTPIQASILWRPKMSMIQWSHPGSRSHFVDPPSSKSICKSSFILFSSPSLSFCRKMTPFGLSLCCTRIRMVIKLYVYTCDELFPKHSKNIYLKNRNYVQVNQKIPVLQKRCWCPCLQAKNPVALPW